MTIKKSTNAVVIQHEKSIAVPLKETPVDAFGCLKDGIIIHGDIVAPIDVEWDTAQ